MKKRLLITSIVMMLVVAVALSTATYAWFTSNASVTASSLSMTAATNSEASIGISWTSGSYGTSISVDTNGLSGLIFAPTAISQATENATFASTVWGSATVKEDSGKKFNTAYNTVISSNDITSASNVDANSNKLAYTYTNGTSTVVYIHNGSTANALSAITAKATITGAAREFIRIAIYRQDGENFKLKGIMGDRYVYTAASGTTTNGTKYYDATGAVIATGDGTSAIPANTFTRGDAESSSTAVGSVSTGGTVSSAITPTATGASINCGGLAVDGVQGGGDVMALKIIVWMDGTALNDDTAGSTGKVANIDIDFEATRA